MADLQVKIGADISAYRNSMGEAAAIASDTAKKLEVTNAAYNQQQRSILSLSIQLQSYRNIAEKATDPNILREYNKKIQDIESEIGRLSNVGKDGFDKLGNAVQSSTNYAGQAFSMIRKIAYILPGVGVAGLIGFFTGPIIEYVASLHLFERGIDSVAISAKHAAQDQEDFNKALNDGIDTAAKEVSHLMVLYQASQNDNLSRQDRLRAVKEIQKEYPGYFGNLSQEAILAGKAAGAYDKLTESLINTAVVKAGQESLSAALKPLIQLKAELAAEQLKLDQRFAAREIKPDVSKETMTGFRQITPGNNVRPVLQSLGVQDENGDSVTLQNYYNKIKDKVKANGMAIQQLLEQYGIGSLLDKQGGSKEKIVEAVTGLDLLKQKAKEAETALNDAVANGAEKSWIRQLAIDAELAEQKVADVELAIKNARLAGGGAPALSAQGTGVGELGLSTVTNVQDKGEGENLIAQDQLENQLSDDLEKGAKEHARIQQEIWKSNAATRAYKKENSEAAVTVRELSRTIGTGLMHAFESALSGTQSFVQAMGQFLLQLIEKILAAAAAAAILAVLLSATGFGSGVSFASLFGQLSGFGTLVGGSPTGGGSGAPGHYATGGIFTKPTVGLFGEAGPEAIVTPKHLAEFANVNAQGGDNPGTLTMKLQGSDMLLFLDRANKTKGRIS